MAKLSPRPEGGGRSLRVAPRLREARQPTTDPQESLRSVLQEIAGRLARLEARVAEVEGRTLSETRRTSAEEPVLAIPFVPQGTIALAGRTLLVLAGAFLVRALTDGQVLPAAAGVALGLAYAAFWQVRADRAGASASRESAAFHGLAGSLVAFPLVFETTARFGLLPPPAGYLGLVVFCVLGLAVAWRHRLAANAALTVVLALAAAIALLSSTLHLVAAVVALLAIAALVEGLAFLGAWPGLRWAAALALDGSVFLLAVVGTRPVLPEGYPPLSIAGAALVASVLPILYAVSIAARTLRRGQLVTAFDVVQGLTAVLLGFGASSALLAVHARAIGGPAALALLLGVLSYATAFTLVEGRTGQDRNFVFYSLAAVLLTLGGTSMLGLGPGTAFLWASLGLAAVVLGRRFDQATLRLHGAFYLAAAAVQTGLPSACVRALAGRATQMPAPAAWIVALAAGAAWLVLAGEPASRSGWARTPHLVLASLFVLSVGKALQTGAWLALAERLDPDAGMAAVARTAIVALLTLGTAWAAHRGSWPELRWLVYPFVVLGGLKLLSQDLREGRPATLVASLALYGAVLLLAPRWAKPHQPQTP